MKGRNWTQTAQALLEGEHTCTTSNSSTFTIYNLFDDHTIANVIHLFAGPDTSEKWQVENLDKIDSRQACMCN